MNEKTKKYLIWGGAGVALIGGGVAVYYYYQSQSASSASSTSSATSAPAASSAAGNGVPSYMFSGLSPTSVATSTVAGGTSESSPPSNPTYTTSSNNLNSFIGQEIAAGNTIEGASATSMFRPTVGYFAPMMNSNQLLGTPATPNLNMPTLSAQGINNPPNYLMGGFL